MAQAKAEFSKALVRKALGKNIAASQKRYARAFGVFIESALMLAFVDGKTPGYERVQAKLVQARDRLDEAFLALQEELPGDASLPVFHSQILDLGNYAASRPSMEPRINGVSLTAAEKQFATSCGMFFEASTCISFYDESSQAFYETRTPITHCFEYLKGAFDAYEAQENAAGRRVDTQLVGIFTRGHEFFNVLTRRYVAREATDLLKRVGGYRAA
ncbi:MAG: hypothetical protein EBQ96_03435 [Proteobacteria bacterium]|nr:hypothetical protein [Pseudomonadota bacterium]